MKVKIYFVDSAVKHFDCIADWKVRTFFEERRYTDNEAFLEYTFDKKGSMVILSQIAQESDENDLQNHGARTMKLIKKIAKDRKVKEVKIELCFEGDGFLPYPTHRDTAQEWQGEGSHSNPSPNSFTSLTGEGLKLSWKNVKKPLSENGFFGKTSEWQKKISSRLFLEKWLLMGRQNDDEFKQDVSKLLIRDEDIIGIQYPELFSIVRGIEFARALTYKPANLINADSIHTFCEKELVKRGVKMTVYEQKDLEQEQMNLFLAVGRSSSIPPKMLVLEYSPDWKNISSSDEVFALVGKGVTYDSGWLYLKPYPYMNEMHGDMGWAATVIWIMSALQELGIKKRVVGVIGLVENMPDSTAYKNWEIITSKSGKTVYISHSDAEGRLVLADMMTFVEEHYDASAIVSIATLTGAVMRALGEMYTGIIGKNITLLKSVKEYGKLTNEWVWELPLDNILLDSLKHPLADVDNIGKYDTLCGAQAGAGFVAQFLKDSSKWVHCDIAGSCLRDKMRQDYDLDNGLGTGPLVHLFLKLLQR